MPDMGREGYERMMKGVGAFLEANGFVRTEYDWCKGDKKFGIVPHSKSKGTIAVLRFRVRNYIAQSGKINPIGTYGKIGVLRLGDPDFFEKLLVLMR